jgi:hypothetical protein
VLGRAPAGSLEAAVLAVLWDDGGWLSPPEVHARVLSFMAAGCPVCNKLVVLAVGASGALAYFRPLQPVLGALSLVLLAAALWARLRARAPSSRPSPT